jgi:carboxylesterase type B
LIGFADSPAGAYRWLPPRYPPAPNATVGDYRYGPQCPQGGTQIQNTNLTALFANWTTPAVPQDEDCLFLDVYVPEEVFSATSPVPVIDWIYGGAYTGGSKEVYSGVPWINSTRDRGSLLIWVAGNYRLGPLGWMAGPLVSNTPGAVANAALYDQRAVLKWIRDNIAKINGDPTRVSAWGESAGAGSIFFQLISAGGTQDPLFTKAVIMSPGFLPQWDIKPNGLVSTYTQEFQTLAQCGGSTNLTCLRGKPFSTIFNAQNALQNQSLLALSVWGPVVDGVLINNLAVLEAAAGHIWPLQSVIVTHVQNEGLIFVPFTSLTTNTVAHWKAVLGSVLPSALSATPGTDLVSQAEARYSFKYSGAPSGTYNFTSEADSLAHTFGDVGFLCNTRALIGAYHGTIPTYSADANIFTGLHGSDILALQEYLGDYSPNWDKYRRFLVSYAAYGDPNTYSGQGPYPLDNFNPWSTVTWANDLGNVAGVGDYTYGNIQDTQDSADICNFWTSFQQQAINLVPAF